MFTSKELTNPYVLIGWSQYAEYVPERCDSHYLIILLYLVFWTNTKDIVNLSPHLQNKWMNVCLLRLGQIFLSVIPHTQKMFVCLILLLCNIILNTRISGSITWAVKRLNISQNDIKAIIPGIWYLNWIERKQCSYGIIRTLSSPYSLFKIF